MDIQTIIVAVVILVAFLYAGKIAFGKVKAFSPKTASCGSDCGCGVKNKNLET